MTFHHGSVDLARNYGRGRDLGTYFLRVETEDGRAFIHKWGTGWRRGGPLSTSNDPSLWISPIYEDEAALFANMVYMHTEGNYACDCNLKDFLAEAYGLPAPDAPCGDTIELLRLTAIRPDRTEIVLWEQL